jgi:hypothetical protein
MIYISDFAIGVARFVWLVLARRRTRQALGLHLQPSARECFK